MIPAVVPAYVLHGLTSIGIGIAKRAGYYPLITDAAAGTNLAGNVRLTAAAGVAYALSLLAAAAWLLALAFRPGPPLRRAAPGSRGRDRRRLSSGSRFPSSMAARRVEALVGEDEARRVMEF